MKKTAIALVLAIMTLLAGTAYAADEVVVETVPVTEEAPAQKDIDVVVNGEALKMDVAPVIVNDRTMVPMRAIFEALGANVNWIATDRLIVATENDTIIIMQIDNERMIVDKAGSEEKKSITLDAVPFILNDRTLVPARAVSEALEATVEWDADTRTVTVTK